MKLSEMTWPPEVVKPITASEAYGEVENILKAALKGHRVLNFRPPIKGELYLSHGLNIYICDNTGDTNGQPRFILKKERTDTERVDAFLQYYSRFENFTDRESMDEMIDDWKLK